MTTTIAYLDPSAAGWQRSLLSAEGAIAKPFEPGRLIALIELLWPQ